MMCNYEAKPEKARHWHECALQVVTPDYRQFVLIDLVKSYEALGLVNEAVEALEKLLPLMNIQSRDYYQNKLDHLKQVKSQLGQ